MLEPRPYRLPQLVLLAALAAAPGCSHPGGSTERDAGSGTDSGPPIPVAMCPTDSMVDLFPDSWPPNPRGARPAATSCIATRHDVVIVLGCPNASDGTASACQTKRAAIAIDLMKAGYGDRFITSGGAVHNAYVEADTLKGLLVTAGVPAESILTDTRAQHTDENIYYATQLMIQKAWTSAVVVSDDPAHLVMTGLCDSNCCVDLGRLTVFEFPVAGGQTVIAGHYARYPWAATVSKAECDQIEIGSKFMCVNLPTRKACADRFQLDGGAAP